MFCVVGDGGFIGIVVGVGLVSLIDEIVCVFPTIAEQTCGHDKMKHFLREEACFKRNHCVATRAAVTLFLGCGPVRKSVGACFGILIRAESVQPCLLF